MKYLITTALWLFALSAHALTNGMALTPPMGWSSWYAFYGNYNETVLREMADAMATNGLQAAGYNFIVLDDCYTTGRDTNGDLVVDPVRFPSGMAPLGAYFHSKGLGFGVYMVASTGLGFCGGPPSYGLEARDVATAVSWDIDVLRVDGLGGLGPTVTETAQSVAARWRDALLATGRPVILSLLGGYFEGWKPSAGNMFRVSLDINGSWHGVTNNLDLMNRSVRLGGPGRWNDPDMIFIGNNSGMNDTENRAFFSLWCMTAAPLILGSDVRTMTAATKAIVTAPELIALDQDPLGAQGTRISSIPASEGNLEVWCKTLSNPATKAVALFNQSSEAADITVLWTNLLFQPGNATVRDLWARADLGTFTNGFTTNVPSHGAVVLKIAGTPYAPPVFLSSLPYTAATGVVHFDRSTFDVFGFPVLNFGEVFYPNGIELETPASVTYDLSTVDGIVTRFVADIGIDADSFGFGEAAFQVWADDVQLLEVGPVTATSPIQTIAVDLIGRRSLKLATSGTGHADWGDARILLWPRAFLRLAARITPEGCLIHLTGGAGTNYSLEASTNLRDWNSITNLVAPAGDTSFLDSSATNSMNRFYRALLLE